MIIHTFETLKFDNKKGTKKSLAHEQGLSLIIIPCWWDGDLDSLTATIEFHRPDLITSKKANHPVSLNPPIGYFTGSELVEVGELMAASFPADSKFSNYITPNSWWLGEKYDGIRCCWNATYRTTYTRTGNPIPLLPLMEDQLPSSSFMDAECWFGRGLYSLTYSLYKGHTDFASWHELRMVAFDVPHISTQGSPFEDRYTLLLNHIPFDSPFCTLAPRVLCKGTHHLSLLTESIIEYGGEGVILRRINSLYEHGKSSALIKLKTSSGDQEGLVVFTDSDGSVTLELPNGKMVVVAGQKVHIPTPKKGDIVTFTHETSSRLALPLHPEITRVRPDLSWQDVLLNHAKEDKFQNEYFAKEAFTVHPRGYWTNDTMRAFMISLARGLNLDPLHPDTWYSIPLRSLYQSKEGRAILGKFDGYGHMLRTLFPDVELDEESLELSSWKEISNRRRFFENHATAEGFDPLVPEVWYSLSREWFHSLKGIHSILGYHENNVSKALIDLFPEIGLVDAKFNQWPWDYAINRRRFFEKYATNSQFDPLIPSNWYSQSRKSIKQAKDAEHVLFYHNNSVIDAILELFPDIGLNRSMFNIRSGKWRNAARRRNFFESFAKENNFDPLVPENWYSKSLDKIMALEEIKRVLYYHKKSVARALVELFPDIGLQKSKICSGKGKALVTSNNEMHSTNGTNGYWNTKESRRKFFEKYALQRGFNHLIPSNWYLQSISAIHKEQEAEQVLQYHRRSVSQAIFDLFPDISFDKATFLAHQKVWKKASNRRRFFEDFAKLHKFNPLIPNNWYSVSIPAISNMKDNQNVLLYHNQNIIQALLDLFPAIGLSKFKFSFRKQSQYSPGNRREFFEEYARESGFDPLLAYHWYSQPKSKFLSKKGASRVLFYHNNNISKALLDLFPDIGLEASKFNQPNSNSNHITA